MTIFCLVPGFQPFYSPDMKTPSSFLPVLAPADPKTPGLGSEHGGGSSPALPGRAQSAGPLLAGASASDKIWHSEKIRFACKFSLRSAREGFAGFGALCLPAALHSSWLAAVPRLCLALGTQTRPDPA